MEAADENVPLNLNAFVLKKAIDGMANAELDNVKPMKSGRVFIEVETRQQCKNLLKTTKLLGYLPVKVSPHRTLNSSKFVIKCEELDKMEEDEIKKELQPQGIIAVKRIPYATVCTFWPSKDKLSQKESILDTWKKKHDHTFPTLKDVFNARNLDIPRIHVKEKPFVLDVVKKDII